MICLGLFVVFSFHLNLKTVPGNGVLKKNFEFDGFGWFRGGDVKDV